jgi:transcriptional regulator with XRE-family HTH domain
LGARIRELAAKQGIAMTHLPDRAGVSRSHFWAVIQAERSPTLSWIAKLAVALGSDPAELLKRPDGIVSKRRARLAKPRRRRTS